jgi:tetratricopeptide (TPR) repeat protein
MAVAIAFLSYSIYRIQSATARAQRLEVRVQESQKQLGAVEMGIRKSTAELQKVEEQLAKSRKAVNYVTQAINAYHAQRYDAAVNLYDKALSLDPLNPYIQNLKGYSLFKAGRLDDAIVTLREAVEIDKTYAWGWFDLARAYCASGKLDAATDAVQRAIELEGDLKDLMRADGEFRRLCQKVVP